MQFSAWPNQPGDWETLRDFAAHIEESGWDGLWVADHFMPNAQDNSGPTGEAWTNLAALAATVPRIRLGTMVTGNTYRHPAVLAKMAAGVDLISGGRLVLGIGSAWQENEHEAYGIPFGTVGGRLRRLEEAIQVIRSLFANERTDFDGRFYQLRDAPLAPKPVQRPGPPLLVGGGGERVTLRIAAQYADEWNVWGTPDVLAHKIGVLERHCEALGRDPAEIHRSANIFVQVTDDAEEAAQAEERYGGRVLAGPAGQITESLGAFIEAGVDELVVPIFSLRTGGAGLERSTATADRFISEVAPAFR